MPPSEERLAWLTGFTGSAGTTDRARRPAALFVDGRYTLAGATQVDTSVFTIVPIADTTPERWLEQNLPPGAKLGYDPWLHTAEGAERLARACANAGATLVPVEPNPIDTIWTDRPAPPLGPVVLHDLRFAGEATDAKLDKIRAEIASLRADALVVSDPHAVAWTFNIRGSDVAHTPLPLAFAIVPKRRPADALHRRRQARPTRCATSSKKSTEVREPAAFISDLDGARRSAAHRAARSGDRRRRAVAHHRRGRRQGDARARSDRA